MTGEGILVRDCMQTRIDEVTPYVRTVIGDAERVQALRKKLLEECSEAALAPNREALLEELADVMEVVIALAQAVGYNVRAVELARIVKREEKGGFDGGTILAWKQP